MDLPFTIDRVFMNYARQIAFFVLCCMIGIALIGIAVSEPENTEEDEKRHLAQIISGSLLIVLGLMVAAYTYYH